MVCIKVCTSTFDPCPSDPPMSLGNTLTENGPEIIMDQGHSGLRCVPTLLLYSGPHSYRKTLHRFSGTLQTHKRNRVTW